MLHSSSVSPLFCLKSPFLSSPTTDAEEAEVDWFYEDLQHLLQLTPKIDVEDWNAKVDVKRYLD